MHRDQAIGATLLAISIIIIIAYIYLMFFPPLAGADIILLKLTGTIAVAAIFAILAWIGYTLATTPPPKPIEEIEKEIEEELKKAETEAPEQKQTESQPKQKQP
jgi:predicted DNA-binding transcriptional regulator